MIKVGLNGYGTIGKRVAEAIQLQKDMKIVGITGHSYSYRIKEVSKNKIPIFPLANEQEFMHHNIPIEGNFENLLDSERHPRTSIERSVIVCSFSLFQYSGPS